MIESNEATEAKSRAILLDNTHPWGNRIFLLSFLMLFLQLFLIRWQGATSLIFSYIPSLPLITSFLGIGLGCMLGERLRLRNLWFLPLLILHLGVLCHPRFQNMMLHYGFKSMPESYSGIAMVFHNAKLFVLFLTNTLVFVPLGAGLGEALGRGPQLRGYVLNLLGSLAGTLTFGLFGALSLGPQAWTAVMLAAALFCTRSSRARVLVIVSCAIIAFMVRSGGNDIWSPYYHVVYENYPPVTSDSESISRGGIVNVNRVGFLSFRNLSDTMVRAVPSEKSSRQAYDSVKIEFEGKVVSI